MYPWTDHAGRLSPLKLAVFVALFGPGLWVALAFSQDWLGARPFNEAIHQLGLWTIRLLFVTLAITPLRQIVRWPRLISLRRMVGVAAFAYGLSHLGMYIASESFNLATVASEIALRIYLTIGFVALLGLAALAATSTDRMVRRLGARRWQKLHRLVYLIALLAVVHFWMQSKLNEWEPTVMAGLYLWLMGYRLLVRGSGARGGLPLYRVGALGIAAAVLTGLGEAGYFRLAYRTDLLRVIAADFSLMLGLRPAVVVFAAALAVTLAGAVRALAVRDGRGRPRLAFAGVCDGRSGGRQGRAAARADGGLRRSAARAAAGDQLRPRAARSESAGGPMPPSWGKQRARDDRDEAAAEAGRPADGVDDGSASPRRCQPGIIRTRQK